MRRVLLVTIVSACGFSVQGQAPVNDDATKRDSSGGEGTTNDVAIDAAIDAPIDAPIDARVCPTAPAGCSAFICAGSSSCYYVCGQGDTEPWSDARDACTDLGLGCLVTINDTAENQCIAAATTPVFPNLVWIGWVQGSGASEPSAGWDWQCGTSSFTASNWGSGEPNNSGGNEDCGAMNTGGSWIDGGCSTSMRWVCELP